MFGWALGGSEDRTGKRGGGMEKHERRVNCLLPSCFLLCLRRGTERPREGNSSGRPGCGLNGDLSVAGRAIGNV